MNRAYRLTISSDSSKEKLEGKVDNVGYFVGAKTGWNEPVANLVKLDIATEPDMIEIDGATLYRYPKLSLPRVKLDTLKDKYNVRVVRDQKKANYSIVSNKLVASLLTETWDNYYTKDYLNLFIETLKKHSDKFIYSDSFIDNIESLYNKLGDTCHVAIKTGYSYNSSDEINIFYDDWNKASRKFIEDNNYPGNYSVILENENVNQFRELTKNRLVLDKCINKICNEDSHIITEDEVVSTTQMLKSGDNDAVSLAVEMLANCNVEECLDKVAFMWTMNYDDIRYANNWNTVNVKALRERLQDITPHNTNYYQIQVYEKLMAELVKEQSLTEWAWKTIRETVHKEVVVRYGFGKDKNPVFNVSIEDIKLAPEYENCIIKKQSGKEIIEELTQPDGFDDLPF
tara:strand:+ start:1573 stop:2772 length:1200 start_codon:yes stop_codon:yes gene_type:complete